MRSGEADTDSDSDSIAPVCGAELGEDVGDVTIDGPGADEEAFGDLRVRQMLAQQSEDLSLAPSQDHRFAPSQCAPLGW